MTAQLDCNRQVRQLVVPLPNEPCFSLGPLLKFTGVPSQTALARRYGLSGRTMIEWRDGGIPMGVADHFAYYRLGVHPWEVWEDWFTVGLADA